MPEGTKERTAVVFSPEQSAARAVAEELAEMKREGRQFNKTTPGGHFLGTDGKPHDAHGRKIGNVKASDLDPEEAAARMKELDDERTELQALIQQQQATAAAEAAIAAESQPAVVEEEEPTPRRRRK